MGGYTEKLQKAAGGHLQPGEQIVAAIRTQPRGSTTGMAVGGLIGAAVASKQASKNRETQSEGSMAASWPHGRFAVGLTNQRLLTFSYTAMGKPKDLTSQFPIGQIAAVNVDKKTVANAVQFQFTDGSAVEVECAKLEKVGDFVSAFQSVKGGASG
jgi:hypothetical protein